MTSDHKVKINEIANEMFQIARDLGFHREETIGQIPDNFGAWCANLHSEVSELWEAYRNRQLFKACDKCSLTCAEEELADIVIRAMNTAVVLGIDLGEAIARKSEYNRQRSFRNGEKLA